MTAELSVSTKIRVNSGVQAPDLPEFSLEGWTGSIIELKGKKASRKYIIEWDAETLENMPAEYVKECEAKQLYHLMACLTGEDIAAV